MKTTGISLYGVELVLGETYTIKWGINGKMQSINVKLIQVTQYGYNFLYEDENRCILKKHLYIPTKKRKKYNGNKKFFLLSQDMVLCIKGKN